MSNDECDESVWPAQRAVDAGLACLRQRGQHRAVISAPEHVADDSPPGQPLNPRYRSSFRLGSEINPDRKHRTTLNPIPPRCAHLTAGRVVAPAALAAQVPNPCAVPRGPAPRVTAQVIQPRSRSQ